MKRARYQEGLNDFEYCVSLHVQHPNIDPQRVTEALGIMPDRTIRVGDPRRNPLNGTHNTSHWSATLNVIDKASLGDSLVALVEKFRPAGDFLRQLVAEGGRIELFFGLFATELCDSLLPYEVLSELADLRIDLRLDYYPKEQAAIPEPESV